MGRLGFGAIGFWLSSNGLEWSVYLLKDLLGLSEHSVVITELNWTWLAWIELN